MTNELEKQFFDTFGIEAKFKGYSHTEELYTGGVIPCGNIKYFNTIEEMDKANYWCFNMWELDEKDKEYPQITDRILLELMFLITDINTSFELRNIRNVTALKTAILEFFIKKYGSSQNRKILKHQVRTLFEEG